MSSLKKKTKSTSQQTATTTPNVPDWLTTPYQTSATQVGQLQATNPSTFAPSSTPRLDQVWSNASDLKAGDYSGSTGLLSGVNYDLTGTSGADFMGRYRDLFSKDITDPVLADYDVEAGKVRASQAADAARNGAFRGSRFGLREAATEGELARGRASTYGGLLKDAANFAMSGGQADAARAQAAAEGNRSARFQGAGLLSDITGKASADQRATLDTQGKYASQEADLLNKIKQYPIEFQQQMQGLLSGLNPDLFTGQTINSSGTSTSKSSSSLGSLLGDFLLARAGGK